MLRIARHQIIDNLLNARFLFLALLIILAFVANGLLFTEEYKQQQTDFQTGEAENDNLIREASDNLQRLSILEQTVLKPPSALSFMAEGGSDRLPNAIHMDAFQRTGIEFEHRSDERVPSLPALDWDFIVGVLMTLLAIVISYDCIAGEKSQGTLRLVLAQPVSRLALFAGKFSGLAATLLLCLLVGVGLNLSIIIILGGPPITSETLWPLAWGMAVSMLCTLLYLLVGITVSSLTRTPTIAMVTLLIVWLMGVVAVPGLGRLVAEQTISIPSQADIDTEIGNAQQEVVEAAPNNANFWPGDPFDPNVPLRAQVWQGWIEVGTRISDKYNDQRMRQAYMAKLFAYFSPQGILTDSLQMLSQTGIHGYEVLYENADRYRGGLHQFVVDRDAEDPNTPHLVYAGRGFFDPGTYSQRPVSAASVPRARDLWNPAGLSGEQRAPLLQLILLLAANLNMFVIAFFALLRYDPR